ncbi:MAG: peptidylprolyl isomerase [Exiguobacterium profundum]|nr:MAG: peptidylprolyl isomerase [Exiguobacterium profundum]
MKIAGLWASLMLSAAIALPALAEDAAPTAATVVATVNGTDITLGHMIALRERLLTQYQSLPDDVLFKGILDQLVQQEVLMESVQDAITLRDDLNLQNDRRGYLSQQALVPVVTAAVTEDAIKAEYDARVARPAPATEYHAAHILVDSEEKAKELKAQLDGGADFAELAKANSTDTGSGAQGGDLGWFGTGMMVKPFEDAVIAAQVGKVTDPVQSDFGWHLILVQETRPAAPPALDDLHDEIAQDLEQKAIEAKVEELTKAAKIEKPGEGIDPAILKNTALIDQ